MFRNFTIFIVFLFVSVNAQVVTYTPEFALQTDGIAITFHADEGNQGLLNYTGDVYAHTGLITNLSAPSPGNPGAWRYGIQNDWGHNLAKLKLGRTGQNQYMLNVSPSIIDFYLTSEGKSLEPGEYIKMLAFVFRSEDGSLVGKTADEGDIFVPVYQPGVTAVFSSPDLSTLPDNGLNQYFPVFLTSDETLEIEATAAELGVTLADLNLYLDDQLIVSSNISPLQFSLPAANYSDGMHELFLIANSTSSQSDTSSFYLYISGAPDVAALPGGVREGINYEDNSTATLVIYAPGKKDIYVIGDFNDWYLEPEYQMNTTSDGEYFWLTLSGLTPQEEYAFQYLIDGDLRIADPYTEIVLDPWNDQYIPASNYPDIPAYPDGKSEEIAAVLQTARSEYQWEAVDYNKPDKSNLIIYEMWLRNFVESFNYQTLTDTLDYLANLGVNAIELMPNSEFEGNDSWGYNPSFYFALDKYYGTREMYKKFIDECHKRDIAVIMDMVLNHSYGQSPLVRMYFENGNPSPENPWYNVTAPHTDAGWGYDFNHTSMQTQKFVDRINEYWVTEYRIDGIRYDFTGGFTQTTSSGGYDQTRIDLLKRMADEVWNIDPSFYVILEHWTDTNEKKALVSHGAMVWGEGKYNYQEAVMGWHENGKSDLGRISWIHQSYSAPGIIGYMESHDEERLMVKCDLYGNGSGNYQIQEEQTALGRMDLAAAFFFSIPGPKMVWMFGELGYDYSIDHNGRLGLKPFVWSDEFYFNAERKRLYKVYSYLVKLKRDIPAFNTSDYSVDLYDAVKKIHLNHADMNVTVLGNFDVVTRDVTASFQNTGTWYDYFTGQSINVTDVNMTLPIKAGDFNIYTTVQLPTPEQGILLGADEENDSNDLIPNSVQLKQNYPNPFNPETSISFSLPSQSKVKLTVYNMLGEKVSDLINGELGAGNHAVIFNAGFLSSGIYYYKLETEGYSESRKMILLK